MQSYSHGRPRDMRRLCVVHTAIVHTTHRDSERFCVTHEAAMARALGKTATMASREGHVLAEGRNGLPFSSSPLRQLTFVRISHNLVMEKRLIRQRR